METLATLKREFISIGTDNKGTYVFGKKSDFNYVKECAKSEFGIEIEYTSSSLQNDDNIRHYFIIK